MADQESLDPFEQARRAAETIEQGSTEDRVQRAAEDAAAKAAADAEHDRVHGTIMSAARVLKSGDPFEPLISQAHCAGLSADQVKAVLDAIKAATGTTLKVLREAARRIKGETEEAQRQERIAGAERRRKARGQQAWGDPDLIAISHEYPAPGGLDYDYGPDKSIVLGGWVRVKGEEDFRSICTPFTIDGRLTLPDTGKGLRIAVRNSDGRRVPVYAEGRNLGNMQGLSKILSDMTHAGLLVFDGKRSRERIMDILAAANPATVIVIVNRPGFSEIGGVTCYMTIDGKVIDNANSTSKVLAELKSSIRVTPAVAQGGSLDDWKMMVDMVVGLNSVPHWKLALIAGFAGSMVNYLGLDNCGINQHGISSIGKTTAQMLAVSIWSSPVANRRDGRSLMETANATVNSVETAATRATGTVLAIDELALRSGREIRDMIFRFTGGAGKRRLNQEGDDRQSRDWETLMITSTEQALETIVRSDRDAKWTAGTAVRIIDLPLDGHVGVVDEAIVRHIKDAARNNYGQAGPVFVEGLLAGGEALREALRHGIPAAALAMMREGAATTEIRTLEVFALLKVAGKVAVHLGLLPEAIAVEATVDWAFRGFLEGSEKLLDPIKLAIEQIRLWVAQNWGFKVVSCEQDDNRTEVMAWYDDDAVYIPAELIVSIARTEVGERTLGKALRDRGMLFGPKLERGRNTTRRIPGHAGLAAYPLSRTKFGVSDSAMQDEFDLAVTSAAAKSADAEAAIRKTMGDQSFEEAIERARHIRDERRRRDRKETWGGGVMS